MRLLTLFLFIMLLSSLSCSALQKSTDKSQNHFKRQIASMGGELDDSKKLEKKIDSLLYGVFHSYLIGQIYLNEFDQNLDSKPETALKSESYNSLLAVRSYVDKFEHEINDLYINLVIVSALPEYGPEMKLNAAFALSKIGKFMEGLPADSKSIPENLRPLVLSSLREKQTVLYEELKTLHEDDAFTNNDPKVKSVLYKNMVLLRATRRAYFKDMNNYYVNAEVLKQTLQEEGTKNSFQELKRNIYELSLEMKEFTSELGRGTSSDEIFPSAGPSGQVSGRGFPAKIWALTFDDGPGSENTKKVIENLLVRKIPATFFVVTNQVNMNTSVLKKTKESGFEIGSHSYTHAQLTNVGSNQLEREIGTSKKETEAKLGIPLRLFRLPYGAGVSVSKVRAKIAQHQMIHVSWNVDSLDWQDKNPESIYERTIKQMKATSRNSGIVLFHDIHSQSVTASKMVMDYLNQEKLTTCSVGNIIYQINKNLPSCK